LLFPCLSLYAKDMTGPIHIWTDGSYRHAHGTLGIAWLYAGQNGAIIENSRTLPRSFNKHGAEIAELNAFTHGLRDMDDNVAVEVHSDCRAVIEWLQRREITIEKLSNDIEVIMAFRRAIEQRDRMGHFIIGYTSENSPNMARADQLSKAASTPGKQNKHAHQNTRRLTRR
jgi:ribonuclease HI